ncbi:MAG: outer membrane lipoprotein-sorting protein [Lentisphaeraceae bacterium]|nr:outer membrane lipoprotein-sorting protein [Lentisphaeraceae bacterium]
MKLSLPKILLTLLVVSVSLMAETPEEKGLRLMTELKLSDQGFDDVRSTLTMSLKDRHGNTSQRFMRNKTLEVNGDGDKSMIIFDQPRDVKGTALLTFAHKVNDDQWLYLPALKRVKRISSSNKSGPFMGSEFAYEDIGSEEVEKYTYKYVRDEKFKSADCYVIERYPVDKRSGYTKQVVWVHIADQKFVKTTYYDRKKQHLKTLVASDYQLFLHKHWRPGKMHMVNHINGKETVLLFKDYKFKTGLKTRDFDRNSLKRAR